MTVENCICENGSIFSLKKAGNAPIFFAGRGHFFVDNALSEDYTIACATKNDNCTKYVLWFRKAHLFLIKLRIYAGKMLTYPP